VLIYCGGFHVGRRFLFKHGPKKKRMYLTFQQALNRISGGKEYKNENYHMTRIRSMVKNGELDEGKPSELFVRDSKGDFVSIGSVKPNRWSRSNP
jgi:hypothetical protein